MSEWAMAGKHRRRRQLYRSSNIENVASDAEAPVGLFFSSRKLFLD